MIRILVNGKIYEEVGKANHIFGSIFMINWDVYHVMSIDAIKQQMKAAIELVKEMYLTEDETIAEVKLPATISRTIKAMQSVIKKIKEKETILNFITNIILAKEGLGLLPGFGCAKTETTEGRKKVKSRLWINPEKQSIRTIK